MHLMWGLPEGRKKLGVRGEKKSFDLPTVQGGLSSSSAHLSPSLPFPPSILHAAANVWMLGWLGKTLSEIYFCWTVLYSFFFPCSRLSTAGSSVRLWIWRSRTWYRHCCLKTRPRKGTPEIRVTSSPIWPMTWESVRPQSLVKRPSRVGDRAVVLWIWSVWGKDVLLPGDGSSSSKTRSICMKSNHGLVVFWSSRVEKPLG